jgi:hypothetical protein
MLPGLVLVGVALFVVAGFLSGDGDEPLVNEPALEAIFPLEGAEVVAQDRVGADLQVGYSGQLTINGTVVPPEQLEQDNGLNQLVFRPGEGKVITRLRQNRNCAEILFWSNREGRDSAGPTRAWCFDVL